MIGFRMFECLWGCDFFLTLGSYMKLEGWSGILSSVVLSFGRLDRPWGSHLRLGLFSSEMIYGFMVNDFEDFLRVDNPLANLLVVNFKF